MTRKSATKKRVKLTQRTPKKAQSLAAYSDAVKDKALAAFATAGTVKGACLAAGISRTTWYDWVEKDPDFGARVLAASEDVTDDLEREAIQRAKDGSDTLIIFLLKSRRPQQYREKQEITLVSPDLRARLERQVSLIASRPTWTREDLLTELEAVWS